MIETAETKHERVHLRLDARSKRKLERAAAYEGNHRQPFRAAQRRDRSRAGDRGARANRAPGDGLGRLP